MYQQIKASEAAAAIVLLLNLNLSLNLGLVSLVESEFKAANQSRAFLSF